MSEHDCDYRAALREHLAACPGSRSIPDETGTHHHCPTCGETIYVLPGIDDIAKGLDDDALAGMLCYLASAIDRGTSPIADENVSRNVREARNRARWLRERAGTSGAAGTRERNDDTRFSTPGGDPAEPGTIRRSGEAPKPGPCDGYITTSISHHACALRAGHAGMHEDAKGCAWSQGLGRERDQSCRSPNTSPQASSLERSEASSSASSTTAHATDKAGKAEETRDPEVVAARRALKAQRERQGPVVVPGGVEGDARRLQFILAYAGSDAGRTAASEFLAEMSRLRGIESAARDASRVALNDAGPEAYETMAALRAALSVRPAPKENP